MAAEENSRSDLFTRAVAPANDDAEVPRTLMVFAHQDDETIALGGRLSRFKDAHIVHVTDGAPKNGEDSRNHGFAEVADYRKARANELCAVLERAGLHGASRECLRVPDQEASLSLAALARTIDRIIRQHEPEVVFTHPYEGGHPDHDACAFAVHRAVALRPEAVRPLIIEAPFYHAGPHGFEAGSFLPGRGAVRSIEYRLTNEEYGRKKELLDLFVTQRETLAGFPLQHERFRIAPRYDFDRPPHTPPVLYDNYPWGMTSREFAELARLATAMLTQRMRATA